MEEEITRQLTSRELIEILGLTIKQDADNKLLTFLACLSCYSWDSQLNLSFNAPSSSGKSFIPLEISQLFPPEDVIKLGSASATAFYHEQGVYDKERNVIIVDLSKKIIIFLDQPSSQLLSRLRALLSHDEREIQVKITDKNQKGGNRTKTVILKGFPSVIFCTASLMLDEQESTRFLLLSPDINQEKLRESINQKIYRDSNVNNFSSLIETDPRRVMLKERIKKIKEMNIGTVNIGQSSLITDMFYERVKLLKPRHQRDIGRIINLAKIFALLNLWNRRIIDGNLYTDEEDVREAFALWDSISESQELNLPPYVYNFFRDVILPKVKEKNSVDMGGVKIGVSRQEIHKQHFEVYGRFVPDTQLRQQILPMLKIAGLIYEEPDPLDKRQVLIYPTTEYTISTEGEGNEPKAN